MRCQARTPVSATTLCIIYPIHDTNIVQDHRIGLVNNCLVMPRRTRLEARGMSFMAAILA
jgi:hypothetical protein